MRTRPVLTILIILILISSSLVYYFFIMERGDYRQYFERQYSTDTEKNAIYASEDLNYTQYFSLPIFNDDWTTNFIDHNILDFYNKTFREAKENNEDVKIEYRYLAMAEHYDILDMKLRNEMGYLNLSINDEEEKVISHNGYALLYSEDLVYVRYLEGANQPPINIENTIGKISYEQEFNMKLNYTNTTIVEMYLAYEKKWGEDSGSLIETYQIILLDENMSPKLIALFPPL